MYGKLTRCHLLAVIKLPIVVLDLSMIFISLPRMPSLADISQELLPFHQCFSTLDPFCSSGVRFIKKYSYIEDGHRETYT